MYLNHLQDFFLDSLWWVVLGTNDLDQFLQEVFAGHAVMEPTTAVLDTGLQALQTVTSIITVMSRSIYYNYISHSLHILRKSHGTFFLLHRLGGLILCTRHTLLWQMDMKALTCAQIWVHAIYMKRWGGSGGHKRSRTVLPKSSTCSKDVHTCLLVCSLCYNSNATFLL